MDPPMVAIAPFRALRYNLDLIGEFDRVLAPPYDVISADEQARLYAASPYNVIRLIYGKASSADTPSDNRYTRARQTLDEWRAGRILQRDTTPAIYLYEHAFPWQGRTLRRLGFVALLQFNGSGADGVLRHEATLEQPKADRAKLLEAVRANLSPIFCVYDEPTGALFALLERARDDQSPLASGGVGEEQVRIWAVAQPDLIRELQRLLASRSILIADGHHRFEVALSKRAWCSGVMSYFSWLGDPAVLMRPIHRVVQLEPDARHTWPAHLQQVCSLTPTASLEQLTAWLSAAEGPGRFGYYEAGRWYQARVTDAPLTRWLLHPTVPTSVARLDVTILHELILTGFVGTITSTDQSIRYTPEPLHAAAMVDGRVGDCAWLLRPLVLGEVFTIASQGFLMPQKSTYFCPKLLSGLFINPFD